MRSAERGAQRQHEVGAARAHPLQAKRVLLCHHRLHIRSESCGAALGAISRICKIAVRVAPCDAPIQPTVPSRK